MNTPLNLNKIIKNISLNIVFKPPKNANKILILSASVKRLGLELAGFLDFYNQKSILVMSPIELSFLEKLNSQKKIEILDKIFNTNPPAIILTESSKPNKEMIEVAKNRDVYILNSEEDIGGLMSILVPYLKTKLAPKIIRHGVLMEVYGMGIFISGESGIGKSETAVELIKRGHRIIADDVIEIKKISKEILMGSAPKNLRYFMELRGIGIINTKSIFGMASVKLSERIDLIVQLETWANWNKIAMYDRMGVDDSYIKMLEINIPFIKIPVKPGRNLAVIIEVATMNFRQRKMGEYAARDLLNKLGIKK